MARIHVTPYEEAGTQLKEVYDELIAKRGQLSEVLKVQSLHPASIRSHVNFYMDIMFCKTALSRAEKELIAVVVSAANGCLYCQTHHGAALQAYWKNSERVEQVKTNFEAAGLTEKEVALCRFAVHLTKHPAAHEAADFTSHLRAVGLSDEGILDVALVTSYFNFVNRMVLSLGVELEAHKGEGYKY